MEEIYRYNVLNYEDGLKSVFQNLFNPTFCEHFLKEKCYENEIIKEKSKAISFLAKTSYGYWDVNSTSLGTKVVSRYYAFLHLCFAEQISKQENIDLSFVENAAKQGHGFFAKTSDDIKDFSIGILSQGYFKNYAKSVGFENDIQKYLSQKKEDKNNYVEKLLDLVYICTRIKRLS